MYTLIELPQIDETRRFPLRYADELGKMVLLLVVLFPMQSERHLVALLVFIVWSRKM